MHKIGPSSFGLSPFSLAVSFTRWRGCGCSGSCSAKSGSLLTSCSAPHPLSRCVSSAWTDTAPWWPRTTIQEGCPVAGEWSCSSLRVPPNFSLAMVYIVSGPNELLTVAAQKQSEVAKGSSHHLKLCRQFLMWCRRKGECSWAGLMVLLGKHLLS